MIEATSFTQAAREHGMSLYSGVPCSYLKPLINSIIDSDDLRYIGAANEGDAVAIAAGAELGGRRSVVIFQNSGLGNAVSPLTSLTYTFRIPVLLIPTLRGEPGGVPDEPQHDLMGRLTPELLRIMGVAWEYFPTEESEVRASLERAVAHMERERLPYALIMRKGSVSPAELASVPPCGVPRTPPPTAPEEHATRAEMLAAVQESMRPTDVVLATTGYTGRELYAREDRDNQLYVVGSMGCASSLSLGLAIAQPRRRVIVLDGDGAALMRLGALCTIAHERPPNLVHILLDNGMHESTGGQATVSRTIHFPGIAASAGYPRVASVATADDLRAELKRPATELSFIYAPISPGIPDELPRPKIPPVEVAERLRGFLSSS